MDIKQLADALGIQSVMLEFKGDQYYSDAFYMRYGDRFDSQRFSIMNIWKTVALKPESSKDNIDDQVVEAMLTVWTYEQLKTIDHSSVRGITVLACTLCELIDAVKRNDVSHKELLMLEGVIASDLKDSKIAKALTDVIRGAFRAV